MLVTLSKVLLWLGLQSIIVRNEVPAAQVLYDPDRLRHRNPCWDNKRQAL